MAIRLLSSFFVALSTFMANLSIDSEKAVVAASPETIYAYLSDMNNFKELMPSSVSQWESTKEHCTFKIPGMGTIGLKLVSHDEQHIRLSSYGPVLFPFELVVNMHPEGSGKTITFMTFNADVNPMMKMMIEKPIGNFFSYLTRSLQKKFDPPATA